MQHNNHLSNNYNSSSYHQIQQIISPTDNNNQPSNIFRNHQNNCTTHNNKRSPSYQQIQYDNKSYHNYINQVNIESPQHIDLQQLIIQPNPNLNNHLSELEETTRSKSPWLQLSQDTSSSVSSHIVRHAKCVRNATSPPNSP